MVIATHADQALDLLVDASEAEKQVLGAVGYAVNETILHTDGSLMPTVTGAGAGWNHLTPETATDDAPPVVTYWMNRLQGSPGPTQYYVTLNGRDRIEPDSILATMAYTHPATHRKLLPHRSSSRRCVPRTRRSPVPITVGDFTRMVFARASRPQRISGLTGDDCAGRAATHTGPRPGRVRHVRRTPLRHGFEHRVYQWLVDLDEPPRIPTALCPFARMYAKDHLGDPGPIADRSDPAAQLLRIKRNVENYLAVRDVDLDPDGRVLMLANARVLGYVFDPLTVFWCYSGDTLRAVVAEVPPGQSDTDTEVN